MTRRYRNAMIRVATVFLAFGLAATACGDDDDDDDTLAGAADATVVDGDGAETAAADEAAASTASTVATQTIDTLRITYDLVGARRGGFTWNPPESPSPIADLGLWHWVYGGLMRPNEDGTLVPELAESVALVDDNTIEVVLRPDLVLPDGSALDATVAASALEQNLARADNPSYGVNFYKLSDVAVVDATTFRLTIPDGTAAGWLDAYMGNQETLIVPEGTDFSAPAGAGPFRVVEFQPEQSVALEKNPDYWDADSIHVERIELVNAPDAQASVLALRGGQVDWAAKIEPNLVDGIGPDLVIERDPVPDFLLYFALCKSEAPFDDARVRRALSLAIDREAINEAVFGGDGEVASGLWPQDHPLHNPELDGQKGYDPDAAKQLLAEAGYPDGFTFDLAQQIAGNAPEVAQIVQQELGEIGVTMNLVPVTNYQEEFLTNKIAPVGISPNIPGRTMVRLGPFSGGALSNTCDYSDPELDSLVGKLQTTARDSDEYVALWNQVDQQLFDETAGIFVVFRPNIVAYNPDVVSALPAASYAIPVPDIRTL